MAREQAQPGGPFAVRGGVPATPQVPVDTAAADNEVALESLSQWQLAYRRFRRHKLALVGMFIFIVMTLIAIFGPILVPYEPMHLPGAIKPGGDAPSLQHIFGTDRN